MFTTLKWRIYYVAVSTFLLFFLRFPLPSYNSHSLIPRGVVESDLSPEVQHTFSKHLDAPLNVSQFGERGIRVQQLSKWAELLINNPENERESFQDALRLQFGFLKHTENTIYTPWSYAADTFSEDVGIVICAGSNNFHLAAHLITSLRRVHHSNISIELAFAGEGDLKSKHRSFLESLEADITFIDLLEQFPHARAHLMDSGWGMKPFAMLASSHKRTILLDADAVFLINPDSLFETHPDLIRTGTLFYRDRAVKVNDDQRRLWVKTQIETAGLEPSNNLANNSLFYSGASWYEMDSGVVALDKTRPTVMLGLIFAAWMNLKHIRDSVTYRVFHGDKETFWLAMELAGFEYFFQPRYAGTIGKATPQRAYGARPAPVRGGGTVSSRAAVGTASSSSSTTTASPSSPPAHHPQHPQNHHQLQELNPGPTVPASMAKYNNNKTELCGTHMLHLDATGSTPFWFNGGIYENKDNPTGQGYARLTHFWMPLPLPLPSEATPLPSEPPHRWYWTSKTRTCVQEHDVRELPSEILRVVADLVELARSVDESLRMLNQGDEPPRGMRQPQGNGNANANGKARLPGEKTLPRPACRGWCNGQSGAGT